MTASRLNPLHKRNLLWAWLAVAALALIFAASCADAAAVVPVSAPATERTDDAVALEKRESDTVDVGAEELGFVEPVDAAETDDAAVGLVRRAVTQTRTKTKTKTKTRTRTKTTTRSGVKTWTVAISSGSYSYKFTPKNITIKAGEVVEWVFPGGQMFPHSVVEYNPGFCVSKASPRFNSGYIQQATTKRWRVTFGAAYKGQLVY